jgi:uncharacterized damage-inducible protein DinB
MALIDPLVQEFEYEAAITRKILEVSPETDFNWKPHEKSLSLGRLAGHIAEIPTWIDMTLTTTELNFSQNEYKPRDYLARKDLLSDFDKNAASALKTMKVAKDADLFVHWSLKNGDKTFFSLPRIAVLRTWCFNHLVHHRGQLSVYLRLRNIPLPSIYGPTADNPQM